MPLHHLDFLLVSLLGTFCLVSPNGFISSSLGFNPSDSGGGGAAVVAAAVSFSFGVLAEAGLRSSPLHLRHLQAGPLATFAKSGLNFCLSLAEKSRRAHITA